MGKGPEVKREAPQRSPSELAAEQQKNLKGSVELNALLSIGYKDGEWPRKEAERTDAITPEKGKTYTAKGGVNRLPFKQELRSFDWYKIMREYASHMARDFDRIDFQFPSYRNIPKNEKARQRIRDLVKRVSGASVDAMIIDDPTKAAEAFKKVLDAYGNTNEIYGAEGVLNVVLAYGRASDTLKGVTPENAGSIDYKLELSNKRYAKLFEKKQVVRAPVEPIAPGADIRKEVAKRSAKEKITASDSFTQLMELYNSKRLPLINRVRKLRDENLLSPGEVTQYLNVLTTLDTSPVTTVPTKSDYRRFEHVVIEMDRIERELDMIQGQGAKKSQGDVKKASLPVGLPSASTPVDQSSRESGAPKEDYLAREEREKAEVVIKEGNLEKNYTWNEDKLDEMAAIIAHDVLEAVSPAVTDGRLYEKLVQPLILASLRNLLNERHSARANGESVSSNYRMSEAEKVRYITVILSQMKTTGTARSKKVM